MNKSGVLKRSLIIVLIVTGIMVVCAFIAIIFFSNSFSNSSKGLEELREYRATEFQKITLPTEFTLKDKEPTGDPIDSSRMEYGWTYHYLTTTDQPTTYDQLSTSLKNAGFRVNDVNKPFRLLADNSVNKIRIKANVTEGKADISVEGTSSE